MLMFLMVFVAVIFVLVAFAYLYLQSMKKKMAGGKEEDQKQRQERLDNLPSILLSDRDDTAIYQWSFHHGDQLVARAVKPEVDEAVAAFHAVLEELAACID